MFRRVTCVFTFGFVFGGLLAFFTSFRVLIHSVRGEAVCLVNHHSVFLGSPATTSSGLTTDFTCSACTRTCASSDAAKQLEHTTSILLGTLLRDLGSLLIGLCSHLQDRGQRLALVGTHGLLHVGHPCTSLAAGHFIFSIHFVY